MSVSWEVYSRCENEGLQKQQYIPTHPYTDLQTNSNLPKICELSTKETEYTVQRELGQTLAQTESLPYASSLQSFQPSSPPTHPAHHSEPGKLPFNQGLPNQTLQENFQQRKKFKKNQKKNGLSFFTATEKQG